MAVVVVKPLPAAVAGGASRFVPPPHRWRLVALRLLFVAIIVVLLGARMAPDATDVVRPTSVVGSTRGEPRGPVAGIALQPATKAVVRSAAGDGVENAPGVHVERDDDDQPAPATRRPTRRVKAAPTPTSTRPRELVMQTGVATPAPDMHNISIAQRRRRLTSKAGGGGKVRGISVSAWCRPIDVAPTAVGDVGAMHLVDAFMKDLVNPGSGIAVGMLVVDADLVHFKETIAALSVPLRVFAVVVNSGSEAAVEYFKRLESAVVSDARHKHPQHWQSAVAKLIIIMPNENLGVAAGWNVLLVAAGILHHDRGQQPKRALVVLKVNESATPAATAETVRDDPWMLVLNADLAIDCGNLAAFVRATDVLAKRGSQAASEEAGGESVKHARLARRGELHPTAYDRCRRARRGVIACDPVNDPAAPVAVHHLFNYAAFAVFRAAIRAVGAFDENLWPAYSEDIEMTLRLRAHGGLTRAYFGASLEEPRGCSASPHSCGIVHLESVVRSRDRAFAMQLTRFGRGEYLYRKWGFDRRIARAGDTSPVFCPFPAPFNLTVAEASRVLLRSHVASEIPAAETAFVDLGFAAEDNVDPQHRVCVASLDLRAEFPSYGPATSHVGGNGDPACPRYCAFNFSRLLRDGGGSGGDPCRESATAAGCTATRSRLLEPRCRGVPNF